MRKILDVRVNTKNTGFFLPRWLLLVIRVGYEGGNIAEKTHNPL